MPHSPRVLVIDDEPAARELLGLALTRSGMDVIEASDGEAGLTAIATGDMDAVVCDLAMPDISGIDVVTALRASPATATLPFILVTGSPDADTLIRALEAGATDFVAKPVQLEELVARIRAHVRTQTAWDLVIQRELGARASTVAALGRIAATVDGADIAGAVVGMLGDRVESSFCSILGLAPSGRFEMLAIYDAINGVTRRGPALSAQRSREMLAKSANGGWLDISDARPRDELDSTLWEAGPALVARAPIYDGDRLIGILALGGQANGRPERTERSRLLATVVDLASVLGAVAGPALGHRSDAEALRSRLRRIVSHHQYRIVYQPIVELETGSVVGWEALTRFDDSTPPDVRFAQARANDLETEFEIAAIEAAITGSDALPSGLLLTVNVSPTVMLGSAKRLSRVLGATPRRVILELSEHSVITDYEAVKSVATHMGFEIAVDDAGAGYASLRHLLELRPTLAKLDISLVHGINDDPVRQALIAGLAFYSQKTGCRLVAEGVEEPEERAALSELRVELGQGYLFGRPEPAATVLLH